VSKKLFAHGGQDKGEESAAERFLTSFGKTIEGNYRGEDNGSDEDKGQESTSWDSFPVVAGLE
jgi:hypothetical protein